MKNLYLLFLCLVLCLSAMAQGHAKKKEPSAATRQYHEYVSHISEPPYSLAKIKNILAHLEESKPDYDADGDDGDRLTKPATKVYQALTLREKFTYHMLHPESWSQNCDASDGNIGIDEEKMIHAYLDDVWWDGGEDMLKWSKRQTDFFVKNKDSVIKWMKKDITRTNRAGLNYKQVMVDINAVSMIPFLVEFYKKERKDHTILTVLMLLMENNKYPEFMSSASHKKLYGDNEAYRTGHLVLNKANEDLIMQRATNFFNGLGKK